MNIQTTAVQQKYNVSHLFCFQVITLIKTTGKTNFKNTSYLTQYVQSIISNVTNIKIIQEIFCYFFHAKT